MLHICASYLCITLGGQPYILRGLSSDRRLVKVVHVAASNRIPSAALQPSPSSMPTYWFDQTYTQLFHTYEDCGPNPPPDPRIKQLMASHHKCSHTSGLHSIRIGALAASGDDSSCKLPSGNPLRLHRQLPTCSQAVGPAGRDSLAAASTVKGHARQPSEDALPSAHLGNGPPAGLPKAACVGGEPGMLKVLEMFQGAGGFSFTQGSHAKVQWATDNCPSMCATYKVHHPSVSVIEDGADEFLALCK